MQQTHQSCTNFRQEYKPRMALKESKPSKDSILFLRVLSFILKTDQPELQCHLVNQIAEEENLQEKMIYRKESHLLFFVARQKDRWTSARKKIKIKELSHSVSKADE